MSDVAPYDAPEISNIVEWINTGPITIAGLKGKVVLIDFWTYSCINCIRTQPYLNAWYDKYKDLGFVIIGVHTPEFEFEKISDNVRRAVKDEQISYPVAMDNSYGTWYAFQNHYWPAKYLIDKDGKIRYAHFGEGAYDEVEERIQLLLKEAGHDLRDEIIWTPDGTIGYRGQSRETYLGYERAENFANAAELVPDQPAIYKLVTDLGDGDWSLGGVWQIAASEATAQGDANILRFKFSAKEVYLVMNGTTDMILTLSLDGKAVTASRNGGQDVSAGGRVHLDGARLYRLVSLPVFTKGVTLDISIPKGVSVNAFTFG